MKGGGSDTRTTRGRCSCVDVSVCLRERVRTCALAWPFSSFFFLHSFVHWHHFTVAHHSVWAHKTRARRLSAYKQATLPPLTQSCTAGGRCSTFGNTETTQAPTFSRCGTVFPFLSRHQTSTQTSLKICVVPPRRNLKNMAANTLRWLASIHK